MNKYNVNKITRTAKPRSKKLQGLVTSAAVSSAVQSAGSSTSREVGCKVVGDYLSKVSPDTAQGRITLAGGAYTDDISSASFVSGFAGEGYQIKEDDGKYNAEFDNLTIRGVTSFYELLIQQIKSTSGGIVVSAANGKISKIEYYIGTNYKIYFDESHNFQVDDYAKCAKFTGSNQKSYSVKITEIGSDFIVVPIHSFSPDNKPAIGDELVQFGNQTDTARQGLVYITATDGGQPRVDIYDGIDSGSLVGKLKGRYGDLSGIVDPDFPDISGYGIYTGNAYLKGDVVCNTLVSKGLVQWGESVPVYDRDIGVNKVYTVDVSAGNFINASMLEVSAYDTYLELPPASDYAGVEINIWLGLMSSRLYSGFKLLGGAYIKSENIYAVTTNYSMSENKVYKFVSLPTGGGAYEWCLMNDLL